MQLPLTSTEFNRYIYDGLYLNDIAGTSPITEIRLDGGKIIVIYPGGEGASYSNEYDSIDALIDYYENVFGSLTIAGVDWKLAIQNAYSEDTMNVEIDSEMILIENIETGERQYVYPDDDIPEGWIIVFTADTGIKTLFPWLLLGVAFMIMSAKR